jgi:hypothetical protein
MDSESKEKFTDPNPKVGASSWVELGKKIAMSKGAYSGQTADDKASLQKKAPEHPSESSLQDFTQKILKIDKERSGQVLARPKDDDRHKVEIGDRDYLKKLKTIDDLDHKKRKKERKEKKESRKHEKKSKKDKKHKKKLQEYLDGTTDVFDNIPESAIRAIQGNMLPKDSGFIYNIRLKPHLLPVSLMRFGDDNILTNGLRSDTVPLYRRVRSNIILGLYSNKATQQLIDD